MPAPALSASAVSPSSPLPDAAVAASVEPSEPAPALPAGIEPGVLSDLEVTGDAPVVLVHGQASARRVLVYLHGACGDIRAPRAWASVSSRFGTLVAVRGDRACGKGDRRYWGPDTIKLQARIRSALARVAEVRGELVDVDDVVLIGYSQGATRAQELARAFPEQYPRVVLAGIPVAPSARHLARARAVAVLGGELELKTHMKTGVWALKAQDVAVRFDVFPKASHGEFGPDAERVMGEALEWVVSR